jgi:hypothetical protein
VPREKQKSQTFVSVIRPYRSGEASSALIESFEEIDGGFGLKMKTSEGLATVLMQNDGGKTLSWEGVTSTSAIGAVIEADGKEVARYDRK